MPGTTQVETTGLAATGIQVGALAVQLMSAQAGPAGVAEAGAASENPGLAAGATMFADQWGRALSALQVSTSHLGETVGASAPAYEMTDSQGPFSRVK